MNSKQEAIEAGNQLLNKMKGAGWKMEVWQNINWNYKVSNGNICVYPSSFSDKYYALLSDGQYQGAGETYWSSNNFSHADPNKVVSYQLKIARDFVNKVEKVVSQLEVKILE